MGDQAPTSEENHRMHIRRAISRALSLGAALAVAGGTIVVGTATPSFAAATATLSQTKGPAAGTNTINVSGTTFAAGAAVQFQSAATCSTNPGTVAAGTVVNATTVTTFTPGATSLNVTAPTALSRTATYYVCTYTGSATTSALISGTSAAVYAVQGMVPVPASGPAAGTNTIVLTDANATFGASTAVEFNTTGCPTTYATPSATVVSGAVTAFTNTTLSVTAPALTAGTYYICAYNGTAANSALASRTTTAGYTVLGSAGTLTLSATRGSSDGGTTLTATDATSAAFGPGTVLEFNNASTCPATYATPGVGVVAATTTTVTATAVTITQPPMPVDSYTVCAYTGTGATSALISASAGNSYTVYGVLSLNTYNGPSAGGNSITATTSGGTFLAGSTVVFHADASLACPATYGTPGATTVATGLRVLTTNKLAFVVPAGGTTLAAGYRVCAYAGGSAGSTLISETPASAPYVVAAPATILSVSPAAGAAQGGTFITVTGTNLIGITGATVGGIPLIGFQSINGGTGLPRAASGAAGRGPLAHPGPPPGGTGAQANALTY